MRGGGPPATVTRPAPRPWLSAALLLLSSGLLIAAAPGGTPRPSKTSDFWQNLADPGRKRYEAAMRRGEKALADLQGSRLKNKELRRRILTDALAAFKEAAQASPGNPRGWFYAAKLLNELDRTKEAIAAFKRTRRADSSHSAFSVAFNLGIGYSKLGTFENAVLEYDRAERVLTSGGLKPYQVREDRSILNGNAAEALMALGRLDESIQRYNEALSLGGRNRTLIRWGLAVAYDRDEQISKAQAMAQSAIAADPKMSSLRSPSVFFIPEGDIHYYFALGHLVQGKSEEAKKEWQLFVKMLPKGQWAPRARAHLTQLGVTPNREPKRGKRLAPVPRQRSGKEEQARRDRDSARGRVQGYLYRMRSCWKKELRRSKSLSGRLRLGFTVGTNGRVTRARVVSSTLRRPTLHQCVLSVIRGISFSKPTSGKPVSLTYPFNFKP